MKPLWRYFHRILFVSQHFAKKKKKEIGHFGEWVGLEIVDCSCDCCFVQSTLDVPERNIAALQEADLSKGMGLKECTHAAFSVLHALQTDLSPGTSQSLHLTISSCISVRMSRY